MARTITRKQLAYYERVAYVYPFNPHYAEEGFSYYIISGLGSYEWPVRIQDMKG